MEKALKLFIDLHTVLMNSKDGAEGRKDNSKEPVTYFEKSPC
jgi:hypothetical protein